MNLWFPYHPGDYIRALQWMKWVRDIGTTGKHTIFLNPAKGLTGDEELREVAAQVFTVQVRPDYEGLNGWPQAPNSCFRQAAWFFDSAGLGHWMFMENDAIPLVPDWLEQLEAEYRKAGKPFMGRLVPAFDDHLGGLVPDHCTGNMICPEHTPGMAPRLGVASDVAFDVYAAREVVPKMHNTLLIQHVFNLGGEKSKDRHPPTFPTVESMALLQPGAVLFHRCKDGSLINRMRERKIGSALTAVVLEAPKAPKAPKAQGMQAGLTPSILHSQKTLPRVYTYFSRVEVMDVKEQEWLIERWKQSWTAHGWQPEVLTINDCEFKAGELDKLRAYPSQNPIEYELACWARWVAMRYRGGLMTDYDVMNYGFTPEDVPKYNNCIRLFDGFVPCVVYGRQKDYANMVDEFLKMELAGNVKHWSDMLALQLLKDRYDTGSECAEYGAARWKKSKLVHFAHVTCKGRSRRDVIPEAERERDGVITKVPQDRTEEPSVSDYIDALRVLCKSPIAKARIVKQLRAAGILPKK